MLLKSYQTKLVDSSDSLEDVFAEVISELPERAIVIVAYKIVATCEN